MSTTAATAVRPGAARPARVEALLLRLAARLSPRRHRRDQVAARAHLEAGQRAHRHAQAPAAPCLTRRR